MHWVNWFGLEYIPFINPGALVWLALACSGFYYATVLLGLPQKDWARTPQSIGAGLALTVSLASHLILFGLFTVQISNAWQAYHLRFIGVDTALAVAYMIYALLLFLWGLYSRIRAFRWFGSLVIGAVSIKTIFWDLSGEATIYKAAYLLMIGLVMLLIAFINQRWLSQEEKEC
ncbi:MAG: DUF2339 domain-containing protein [Leptospiraceae bacterium]|nr:DUF2339 domain-containing protein [Leptospiraceae bacterium]